MLYFCSVLESKNMAAKENTKFIEELLKSGNGGITITLTVDQLKEAFTIWNEEQLARRQQEVPVQEDEYLDVESAAKFLNASASSVRRWSKVGNFPTRRRGAKMYFLRSDLEKFMNEEDLVTEQSAGW